MKRRSKDDIIASILRVIIEKHRSDDAATTYRIMSNAHLSFLQAEEYLKILIRAKLLECNHLTREYEITEKGYRFLALYSDIKDIMNAIDNSIRHTIAE